MGIGQDRSVSVVFANAFMDELSKLGGPRLKRALTVAKYGLPAAAVGIPLAALYAGTKGAQKGKIEALQEQRERRGGY